MTDDPLIGKQLGNFRVVDRIAQGASAVVYKARQVTMNDRLVALKILKEFADDTVVRDEWVRSFRNEAAIIARLQHPNILPVIDAGEHDGRLYLAMQLIETGTLHEHLEMYRDAGEDVPVEQVRRVVRQIAAGLDYAHGEDVIHRDVKPLNVLIDKHLHCFVSDFGIGKIVDAQAAHTRGIKGTPWYMSPEQCMGEKPDSRSDIYALGVILYEMVVGDVPFRADSTTGILMKQVKDPPEIPAATRAKIPEELRDVILKALAKDREERYQTGAELVRDLEKAVGSSEDMDETPLSTVDVPATKLSMQGAQPVHRRSNRVAILAIITAAGLLAIFSAAYFMRGDAEKNEDESAVIADGDGSTETTDGGNDSSDEENEDETGTDSSTSDIAPPIVVIPWELQASDLVVGVHWSDTSNSRVNTKLGAFKDGLASRLAPFRVKRIAALPGEETAERIARLALVDFQALLAELQVDALLHVELAFEPGTPDMSYRRRPSLRAIPTLLTRDDGRREAIGESLYQPARPVNDIVEGLVPELDPEKFGRAANAALTAWKGELNDRGRSARLLIGTDAKGELPSARIRKALADAGAESTSIEFLGGSRPVREIQVEVGPRRIRFLEKRQHWREIRFRIKNRLDGLLPRDRTESPRPEIDNGLARSSGAGRKPVPGRLATLNEDTNLEESDDDFEHDPDALPCADLLQPRRLRGPGSDLRARR